MLILRAPRGFENFILELAEPLDGQVRVPDMQKLIAAAARAGIDILGPLPEEPA